MLCVCALPARQPAPHSMASRCASPRRQDAAAIDAEGPTARTRGRLPRRRPAPCVGWLVFWLALPRRPAAAPPSSCDSGAGAAPRQHEPCAGALLAAPAGGAVHGLAACFVRHPLCKQPWGARGPGPRAARSAACARLGAAADARGRARLRAAACWMQAGGGGEDEPPPTGRGGKDAPGAAPLPLNPLMRRAMQIRALGTNSSRAAPPGLPAAPPAQTAPAPEAVTPSAAAGPAPAPALSSATGAGQTAQTPPAGNGAGVGAEAAAGTAQAGRRRGRPRKDGPGAGGAAPTAKAAAKARPAAKAKATRASSPPLAPAARAAQAEERARAPKRARGRPPRQAKPREEQRGLEALGVTRRRERLPEGRAGAAGLDQRELRSDEGSGAGGRTAKLPPAGAPVQSPLYQLQQDIPQWVKVRAAKQDSESANLRKVLVKEAERGLGGETDAKDLDRLPVLEDVRAPLAPLVPLAPLPHARTRLSPMCPQY